MSTLQAKKAVKFLAVALLTAVAAVYGCGGSGGGSSSSDTDSPTTATGYFIDSAVQGLSYVSGGQSDTTDADGKFTYEVGKTVRFFIGNIVLGEVTAKGYMTPVDLVTNADASNATVLNIARFLMTLDSDNDPTNGIIISDATRTAAQSASTIDFSTATDTTLTTVLVQLNISITLVTVTDAQTHLTGSIYGLYTGTYSGTLTVNGSSLGTFSMTVDSAGAMNGSININNETETLSGQVSTSGIVTFTLSGKTDTYSGTIDASTGAFSATCTSGCVDNVTFTGSRQSITNPSACSVDDISFEPKITGSLTNSTWRVLTSCSGPINGIICFEGGNSYQCASDILNTSSMSALSVTSLDSSFAVDFFLPDGVTNIKFLYCDNSTLSLTVPRICSDGSTPISKSSPSGSSSTYDGTYSGSFSGSTYPVDTSPNGTTDATVSNGLISGTSSLGAVSGSIDISGNVTVNIAYSECPISGTGTVSIGSNGVISMSGTWTCTTPTLPDGSHGGGSGTWSVARN